MRISFGRTVRNDYATLMLLLLAFVPWLLMAAERAARLLPPLHEAVFEGLGRLAPGWGLALFSVALIGGALTRLNSLNRLIATGVRVRSRVVGGEEVGSGAKVFFEYAWQGKRYRGERAVSKASARQVSGDTVEWAVVDPGHPGRALLERLYVDSDDAEVVIGGRGPSSAILLEAVRGAVGDPPRQVVAGDLLPVPDWVEDDEESPFRDFYEHQELTFSQGRVVWGRVVQANQALLEPGEGDLPGAVVFDRHGAFDRRLDLLGLAAEWVNQLRDHDPGIADLESLRQAMTDPYWVPYNLLVPEALWAGPDVVYTSLIIGRRHLPVDHLVSWWLPLMVFPERSYAALVVPASLWPERLKELWVQGLEPESGGSVS